MNAASIAHSQVESAFSGDEKYLDVSTISVDLPSIGRPHRSLRSGVVLGLLFRGEDAASDRDARRAVYSRPGGNAKSQHTGQEAEHTAYQVRWKPGLGRSLL